MVEMVSLDGKTTLDVPPEMFEPDGVRAPQSNPDDITPAMLDAGERAEADAADQGPKTRAAAIYRAMRAAAR